MIERKKDRWSTLKAELERVPGYENVIDMMHYIEEMFPHEFATTGYGFGSGFSTTPVCPVCKQVFQMSSYRFGTCGKVCEEIFESGKSSFLEDIYERDPKSESVQAIVKKLQKGGVTTYNYMIIHHPEFKCVSCGKIIPEGEEFLFTMTGSEIYCMRCEP